MRRYAELDGLRAIAITLVILFHAGPYLPESHTWLKAFAATGWNGVYLFFVLSGFLIGGLALSEIERTGTLQVRRFWIRRILRTWPLYYVLLAINVVRATTDGVTLEPPIGYFLTFTQNLFPQTFFIPTWSLAVEEQFYLLLPLIGYAIARLARRRFGAVVTTVVLALLAPWITRALWGSGNQLWIVVDALVVGLGVALLRRYRAKIFGALVAYPNALFVLGLVLVYAPMPLADGTMRDLLLLSGQAWGFGCIVASALSGKLIIRTLLNSRTAYLGALISYSVYLTHGDALFWIGRLAGQVSMSPFVHTVFVMGGGVIASALVGTVFYIAVERPGMQFRNRYFPRI